MLYVDTDILVYLLEQHHDYSQAVAHTLEANHGPLITSTITVVEFLAGTVSSTLATLHMVPGLQFIELNDQLAEQAATYQRKHGMQIGDAIHLATAVDSGTSVFFTNDKQLAKIAAQYLTIKTL